MRLLDGIAMVTSPREMLPGLSAVTEGPLRRLDVRSKFITFTLLIVATFSTRAPQELLVLALCLGGWLSVSRPLPRRFGALVYALRYLLLFTLLVHLLFTPGFRLLGVSWLSREGLELGGVVCAQLVIALGFSLLLSGSSSAAALARGVERLLRPLARLGVPVGLVGESLALVLHFVERLAVLLRHERKAMPAGKMRLRARLESGASAVSRVLEASLGEAEDLAHELVRSGAIEAAYSPDASRFFWHDMVFMASHAALVALLLWS